MAQDIESAVRQQYGSIAKRGRSSRQDGVRRVAESFGYSEDELTSIPAEANMGLSCGNPTALASLRPGEVVLDLGSGGGFDVFIAGRKVGPTGRATYTPWLTPEGGFHSDLTMQRLADILNAEVDRPTVLETTALGAAWLAGHTAGVWPDQPDARAWSRCISSEMHSGFPALRHHC